MKDRIPSQESAALLNERAEILRKGTDLQAQLGQLNVELSQHQLGSDPTGFPLDVVKRVRDLQAQLSELRNKVWDINVKLVESGGDMPPIVDYW